MTSSVPARAVTIWGRDNRMDKIIQLAGWTKYNERAAACAPVALRHTECRLAAVGSTQAGTEVCRQVCSSDMFCHPSRRNSFPPIPAEPLTAGARSAKPGRNRARPKIRRIATHTESRLEPARQVVTDRVTVRFMRDAG